MYEFTDTIQEGMDFNIPSEALILNKTNIELEIDGYRTLTVSGRELMGQEVQTEPKVGSDGSMFLGSRVPERFITVQYKLKANNEQDFRQKFNKLNQILSGNNKTISFEDEPGYHFIGTLESVESVPPGTNSVISSFTFICHDPYKYSDYITISGVEPAPKLNNRYKILPTQITFTPDTNTSHVSLDTYDKSITFDGATIKAGDSIVLLFESLDAFLGNTGENLMPYMTMSSDFETFYLMDDMPLFSYPEGIIELEYKEVEL